MAPDLDLRLIANSPIDSKITCKVQTQSVVFQNFKCVNILLYLVLVSWSYCISRASKNTHFVGCVYNLLFNKVDPKIIFCVLFDIVNVRSLGDKL